MADQQPNPALNRKPQNKFVRFLLKSWQPVPTWQSTIILFFIIGLALIGFGIALVVINSNIVEISKRYDDDCGTTSPCTITITVPEKMKQPVFLYYEIDNFYQNHRRYINSRSTQQLAGESVADSSLRTDCSPAVTNAQMDKTVGADKTTPLTAGSVAVPCGLIAKSLFNDTFLLHDPSNVNVTIDDQNIVWPSDKGTKFKNPKTPIDNAVQWIDMEDPHFIVWMRTAGLPDFRKLWGRIDTDLPAGDYSVIITNQYPVKDFDGKKKVVLSTTGPFGGKNNFLSITYLAVGGVCIAVSVFFFVRWMQYKKKNQ